MDQYFKLVREQKRVDGINLIETAGGCIVAGVLKTIGIKDIPVTPDKRYVSKNIQETIQYDNEMY